MENISEAGTLNSTGSLTSTSAGYTVVKTKLNKIKTVTNGKYMSIDGHRDVEKE